MGRVTIQRLYFITRIKVSLRNGVSASQKIVLPKIYLVLQVSAMATGLYVYRTLAEMVIIGYKSVRVWYNADSLTREEQYITLRLTVIRLVKAQRNENTVKKTSKEKS